MSDLTDRLRHWAMSLPDASMRLLMEAVHELEAAHARLAAIEGIVHSAIPDADKIAGITYCLGRKFEG